MLILIALIGGVMNKIRGGILTDIYWSFGKLIGKQWKKEVPFVKTFNDLIFAGVFICIVKGNFLYISDLSYKDFGIFFTLFFSMFVGRSWGWGNYIGGIIFRRIYDQPEVKWIDKLIMNNNNYPVLRSVVALSLRGFMWTSSIAIGFYIIGGNWLIAFIGLFMGPVYWLLTEICDKFSERFNGWTWGEFWWGFILWGSCFYFI
jgi:hypothetical protein